METTVWTLLTGYAGNSSIHPDPDLQRSRVFASFSLQLGHCSDSRRIIGRQENMTTLTLDEQKLQWDALNFARKNKKAIARELADPAILVPEVNPVSV